MAKLGFLLICLLGLYASLGDTIFTQGMVVLSVAAAAYLVLATALLRD